MNPTTNDIPPQGYKMTELGALPEDWEVVKLGEVFNVQQGKQLSEKESKEGKIKKPFLRTSNLTWDHIDISSIDEMYFTSEEFKKLKLESGDILVCEGGDVGRTALYRGELVECAYQNHLHRLRPKKDNLDVECFVFWMNYAINQRKMYTHSANRTTIPNLSGSRLKEFLFPLPPLPEQQRIAAVLSAVQTAKEKTEAVIAAAKALKKSMMKHLFTYGPVPPEETENVRLKETEIGKVPEDWEVVRLGEYCNIFSGYAFKSDDFRNDGVLVIKIGNLQNGSIVLSNKESFFPREKINDNIAKYILNEGDVLIALTGATTGKISVVPKNVNGALLNQRVGKFSIYNDSIYQSFAMYYFMTDVFQNHIKTNILQSAQGNISPQKIESFKIPLPPLPTQQKIASILSAIDAKIEAEEKKKQALEELFKTLLHNLMTAKNRVDHLEVKL